MSLPATISPSSSSGEYKDLRYTSRLNPFSKAGILRVHQNKESHFTIQGIIIS